MSYISEIKSCLFSDGQINSHIRDCSRHLAVCIVIIVSISSGCKCQSSRQPDNAIEMSSDLYYETISDTSNFNWLEEIPVFHYWKTILNEDYLFSAPTAEQVASWQSICEKENHSHTVMRSYVQKDCLNMNHYMTINDFMGVWAQQDPYGSDDAFTLWRLEQYNTDDYSLDSEFDRFLSLKSIIQSLCRYDAQFQFEMNFKAGMEEVLQELYCRTMLRESIRHSEPWVATALRRENEAWEEYHTQLDSTFRIIDGEINGLVGSAWSMAISGILYDDARIREASLADFYFALADSLDYEIRHKRSMIVAYELEKHSVIPEERVLREYRNFMSSLEENELAYPVPQRKKALSLEMDAWKKWMTYREEVSSILTGQAKECYDNSTNNVRRLKFIMLKNQYQGYGITSNDVMECLIPYTASDEELKGPSFDERWKDRYGYSL